MSDLLVLVAHGTVESLDDLPAFVLEIRRGRPAPPELLVELRRRYERVGGSPLLTSTRQLGAAVEAVTGLETRVAMRLWEPRLEEVVKDLGPSDRVCLLPLAPYSVHVYEAAASRALQRLSAPPALVCVPSWGEEPELLEAWRSRIALVDPPEDRAERAVVLTAHSLPLEVVEKGDPYALEFERAARRLEGLLGRPCRVAYQSQGEGGGAWLGPDLKTTLEQVRLDGAAEVVVAPVGFLAEHIETLFDLDVEAKEKAKQLGLRFTRVETLGTDPALSSLLGRLARQTLGAAEGPIDSA